MKNLTQIKRLIVVLFLITFNMNSKLHAQSINIEQDEKFEQLLNEKRKINPSITNSNRFKIQIYTGTNENAKKELVSFKKENKNLDATLIFNTPNYKVIVGNYKTRIEAEKKLALLKKKYSSAILIKPTK